MRNDYILWFSSFHSCDSIILLFHCFASMQNIHTHCYNKGAFSHSQSHTPCTIIYWESWCFLTQQTCKCPFTQPNTNLGAMVKGIFQVWLNFLISWLKLTQETLPSIRITLWNEPFKMGSGLSLRKKPQIVHTKGFLMLLITLLFTVAHGYQVLASVCTYRLFSIIIFPFRLFSTDFGHI